MPSISLSFGCKPRCARSVLLLRPSRPRVATLLRGALCPPKRYLSGLDQGDEERSAPLGPLRVHALSRRTTTNMDTIASYLDRSNHRVDRPLPWCSSLFVKDVLSSTRRPMVGEVVRTARPSPRSLRHCRSSESSSALDRPDELYALETLQDRIKRSAVLLQRGNEVIEALLLLSQDLWDGYV